MPDGRSTTSGSNACGGSPRRSADRRRAMAGSRHLLDALTRESLAIRLRRKLASVDVIDGLTDLFILRGPPALVRSDNGPAFVAKTVQRWITAAGARTAFIEPGSPCENGCRQRPRPRRAARRRALLFPAGAQTGIEQSRRRDNTSRPHSSLAYRPPAPGAIVPPARRSSQPCTNSRPRPSKGGLSTGQHGHPRFLPAHMSIAIGCGIEVGGVDCHLVPHDAP